MVFLKMGIIFSIFRKKSSVELLENVAEEIKELKACSVDTELRHRKITRQLMIYSSGLCVIFAALLYFYIPPKLQTKIILISSLLLSPIIYYAISRIISWYYRRKIRSSHSRLKYLEKEKKRLIDDIMDKETYKVAKDILEKYAPETLPQKYPPRFNTGTSPGNTALPVLRSNLSVMPPANRVQENTAVSQKMSITPRISTQSQIAPRAPGPMQRMPPSAHGKSYIDRFFEYLIGDGPNTRYALICSRCSTHNGMALMEEFEYTAFKCYICQFYNPARKQRPVAPKLESEISDEDDQQSEGESISSSMSETGNVKIDEVEDEEIVNEDPTGSKSIDAEEQLEMNMQDEDSSSLVRENVEDDDHTKTNGSSVEESKTEPVDSLSQSKSVDNTNSMKLNLDDLNNKKTDSVDNGYYT